MYLEGNFWSWLAGGVFLAAGLTDLLDGWLARRLKKDSRMGRFLDPLADKLLVSSMLVMLAALGKAPGWMAVLIICREIGVTGLRAIAASQDVSVPSDIWGKSKTALQIMAVFLLILPNIVSGYDIHRLGMAALWAALIITGWSGGVYFWRFRRQIV